MRDGGVEISSGLVAEFDGANKTFQSAKPVELVAIAEPGRIERSPKKVEGLVIGLQRNGKRMTVLSAVRKCKTGGIGESAGCAVHHFGNECQGLQRARSQIFQKQERREIAQITFVRD